MQLIKKSNVIVLSCLIGIFLSSCGKGGDQTSYVKPAKRISLTTRQAEVVISNNSFAFDLFCELCKLKPEQSIIYSPLSVQSVLSILLNGAKGDTYSQIASALGYEGYSLEDINGLYSAIENGLSSVDKTVHYSNANSLWLNGFEPKAEMQKELKTYYDIYIQNRSFASADVAGEINGWCSKNTGGRITNIVEKLNPNDLMLVINALYFEGPWKEKFSPSNTLEGAFYKLDGKTEKVKFMRNSGTYMAAEKDGVKMCVLPFGNGGYNLAVVLPDREMNYKSFVSGLNYSEYEALWSNATKYHVSLSIPRLLLDTEITEDLRQSLETLGITNAFNDSLADFSGFFDNCVSMGMIKQRAHIEIDEDGVKVAAATSTGTSGMSSHYNRMEFNADHPFLLIVYENSTRAILLMGSVVS